MTHADPSRVLLRRHPLRYWRPTARAGCLACTVALCLVCAGHSAPHPVGVVAKEFAFVPKDITAPPGEIAFDVRNQGEIDHNFVIDAAGGKTVTRIELIHPGEDRKFSATLPAGVYTIYCSLPGHREAGMAGTLRVTETPAAAPSPSPTTSTDKEAGAAGSGEKGSGGMRGND